MAPGKKTKANHGKLLGKSLQKHRSRVKSAHKSLMSHEQADGYAESSSTEIKSLQSLISSLKHNPGKSLTQHSNNLDEFLEKAILTNEKYASSNVATIVSSTVEDSFESFKKVITEEEATMIGKKLFQVRHLPIPRRPDWRKLQNKEGKGAQKVTKGQLNDLEQASFIAWRRKIAELEEHTEDMLPKSLGLSNTMSLNQGRTGRKAVITPFEKNLEFWRQLWRVVERSDLIVQVVDARNPLLFRCQDLELYTQEVASTLSTYAPTFPPTSSSGTSALVSVESSINATSSAETSSIHVSKGNIVVLNKADFMSEELREEWRQHFVSKEVKVVFFSAKLEQEKLDAVESPDEETALEESELDLGTLLNSTKLLTRDELVFVLVSVAKTIKRVAPGHYGVTEDREQGGQNRQEGLPLSKKEVVIGMVGYPNVGKSSCINVLLGVSKTNHHVNRVSVAATPGHTKHFQTMDISPIYAALVGEKAVSADNKPWLTVTLCDCPGLVFPSFVSTKADLYLNGILPIDEIRSTDYFPPLKILCSVIPRRILERVYSISFDYPPERRYIDPIAFIEQFCRHKKLFGSGRGRLNEPQGAKIVLKDFVSGKLVFCKPPPASQVAVDKLVAGPSGDMSSKPASEAKEEEEVPSPASMAMSDLLYEERQKLTTAMSRLKTGKVDPEKKAMSRRTKHKKGKNRNNNGNPYEVVDSSVSQFLGAYVLDKRNKNQKQAKGTKTAFTRKASEYQ